MHVEACIIACMKSTEAGLCAAVQFTNSAVSATTSSYTSQCVNDFVPADADLILVEFSVNDWETGDPATFTWMDNSLRQVHRHAISACFCTWKVTFL